MANYTHTISRNDEQVKVEVTVTAEAFNQAKESTIARMSKDVKIKGFRPGKAPKEQVEAALGTKWFSETVRELLPVIASDILEQEDLNPVTQLDYDIADLPDDGGLKFTFTFTEYPEVKLGDFSKLKVENTEPKVEEKDINSVMQSLVKTYAKKPTKQDKDADAEAAPEVDITDEMVAEMNLPEAKTKEELRGYVESKLKEIKQRDHDKKYMQKLLEAAVKVSTFKVPEQLAAEQADKLYQDYIKTITGLGIELPKFLEAQGTSEESLKQQKIEEAKNLIGQDLVLNQIVREYKLIPSVEDIEHELSHITDDSMRAEYDTAQGRRYILSVLVRQRGLDKLRELATAKK